MHYLGKRIGLTGSLFDCRRNYEIDTNELLQVNGMGEMQERIPGISRRIV